MNSLCDFCKCRQCGGISCNDCKAFGGIYGCLCRYYAGKITSCQYFTPKEGKIVKRLTYNHPEGGIAVDGVDFNIFKNEINGAVYLCICRLFDYENTGLTPQEVADLIRPCLEKSPEEYVHIGSEFAGYRVFALSDRICIAERIDKLGFDDYVVWYIEDYHDGVWGGVYFEDRQEALAHFADKI